MRSAILFQCIVLLGLLGNLLLAQTTITGKITDEKGEPLPNASITSSEINNSLILTYAISDNYGDYILELNSVSDSLEINISFIGFESQKKIIAPQSQILNVSLLAAPVTLKEVFVEVSPIAKTGDTINYNIGFFKEQKDRVIGDVLKKLPGIEVARDGSVLYQGKPILKYYIEGLDLLGGRYNLANNNLPADAVSDVQILENHQPIKVLDTLVFSDNASLNIKLKNKITTTGTAKTGLGIAPILWDDNITPMLFTKKQQAILSYQANNTGNDVSKDLKILSLEELLSQLESNSGRQNWLKIQELSPPPFPEHRWLANNAHLFSTNYLLRLKKEYELKVAVSYLNDYQRQAGNTETTIYTTTDTLQLVERKNNALFFNSLESKLSLTKNTKQNYLKNDIEVTRFWDSQRGLLTGSIPEISQNVQNPFTSFNNRLKWIIPIDGKLATVSSAITYTRSPQQLQTTPGVFQELLNDGNMYDETLQKINLSNFYTDNSISFTKGFKKITITPNIGFLWHHQYLRSQINTITGGSSTTLAGIFQNNLNYFRFNSYTTINTEYKYKSGRIVLITPLTFRSFMVSDNSLDEEQKLKRLTFEPNLYTTHQLDAFWKVTFSAGLANTFGAIEQLYYGFILPGYRNIQRYNASIPKSSHQNYRLGLFYRNPLKSFFADISYTFRHTKNNLLTVNSFDENGAAIFETIERDNYSATHYLTLKASNYFSKIKTTISGGPAVSTLFNTQVINDKLTDVKTQSTRLDFKINTEMTDWLSINYKTNLSFFYTKLENQAFDQIKIQEHNLNASLYPDEYQYININVEYYANTFLTENKTNSFLNLTYRYTFPKSKMDLEATWTNLLNTQQFIYVFANEFSYLKNSYELRPSQILVSLRFRL